MLLSIRPPPFRGPLRRRTSCRAFAGKPKMFHVVSPGETLGFIASQYGVPLEDLKAANKNHEDILRPQPGKELAIPQPRVLHIERPQAVQTIANLSASLSKNGFQSAVAANAPWIQLIGGLFAAAALGRMLLQWAPSPALAPAQSPGGLLQPPTTSAFSGVDVLLQEAQQEITQVEGQLHGLQVTQLRQPVGRQKGTLPPPETERVKGEDPKPGKLHNLSESTATLALPQSDSSSSSSSSSSSAADAAAPKSFSAILAPPSSSSSSSSESSSTESSAATLVPPSSKNSKSSSTESSTATLVPSSSSTESSTATLVPPSSSSSSSISSSASSPATEVLGPETAGRPDSATGEQQGGVKWLFGFTWQSSQPQQAAQPQTRPLPFQEPEQPQTLPLPFQEPEEPSVPPFSGPAELVVQSTPAPLPPPPTSTLPLKDPFAGKSLISLKSSLMDEVIGTSRGVTATGRQRGAIEELILALEARNPQPKPTSCMGMMEGHWKLVYTTNTQTLMMLNAIAALPLVDVGNVYQIIDAESMTASNKVDIALPASQSWPFSLTSEATFEVRTPRAFKVRFTKVGLDTYVQTPQVLSALEIPDTISVLGTSVDLTPLRELVVNPVNAGLERAQSAIHTALNPEFGVQVSDLASSWMLTTYLDETVRISRDEAGRSFIMMKDFEKDEPLFANEGENSSLG